LQTVKRRRQRLAARVGATPTSAAARSRRSRQLQWQLPRPSAGTHALARASAPQPELTHVLELQSRLAQTVNTASAHSSRPAKNLGGASKT
jgi:hypothetical protein